MSIWPIRVWVISYTYGLPIRIWVIFHDPYAYGLPIHVSWGIIDLPIWVFVPVHIWVSCPHAYMTYVYQYSLGHEQMIIFNIQTFFNFQLQMFECLLMPTQWVFNSVINLCNDDFMVKTSNRYPTTIDLKQ